VEYGALGTVSTGSHTIIFKNSDAISSASHRGNSVKKLRIFIPFHRDPDVKTLSPERELFGMNVLEPLGSQAAQGCFVWTR
jgi:hypothetical protein